MFQKGTGERFKYKAAVQNAIPQARCVKHTHSVASHSLTGYMVRTMTDVLSGMKSTAERAWEDAWIKHVQG